MPTPKGAKTKPTSGDVGTARKIVIRPGADVAGLLRNPFMTEEYLQDLLEAIQDVAEERLEAACDRLGVSTRGLDDEAAMATLSRAMTSPGATASDRQAWELMQACIDARFDVDRGPYTKDRIVVAFAKLDADLTEKGRKFQPGRDKGAVGPIRARVRALLRKTPTMKNAELWDAIAAKPPRGYVVRSNRLGQYIEGPNPSDSMSLARFRNICAEERKANLTG